jgi:hypothetical protein
MKFNKTKLCISIIAIAVLAFLALAAFLFYPVLQIKPAQNSFAKVYESLQQGNPPRGHLDLFGFRILFP